MKIPNFSFAFYFLFFWHFCISNNIYLYKNSYTCIYSICSFLFLFIPWYVLEKPGMEISQIRFNFWIFFSNALCALALNFSIFLVIGRTGAVTIRVAGVLKDWILIALSTIVFPESTITGLNIIGYAIGKLFCLRSCSLVLMYLYLLVFLFLNHASVQLFVVLSCTTIWRSRMSEQQINYQWRASLKGPQRLNTRAQHLSYHKSEHVICLLY